MHSREKYIFQPLLLGAIELIQTAQNLQPQFQKKLGQVVFTDTETSILPGLETR